MKTEEELIWEAYSQKSVEQFYEENNIDEDDLGYLGSGDFGNAYLIGDSDRVLKITTSKSEFEVAQRIKNNPNPFLATIHEAEDIGGDYYIIVEKLETDDSNVEDYWYRLQMYLDQTEDQIPISEMNYIDIDDVEQEIGENFDEEFKRFANDLGRIISVAQRYAGISADVSPENIGVDGDGNYKLFDLDPRDKSGY